MSITFYLSFSSSLNMKNTKKENFLRTCLRKWEKIGKPGNEACEDCCCLWTAANDEQEEDFIPRDVPKGHLVMKTCSWMLSDAPTLHRIGEESSFQAVAADFNQRLTQNLLASAAYYFPASEEPYSIGIKPLLFILYE